MGREGEVAGELIREFERDNPGIRVRLQQMPWTSAHEKLLTAFAGDVLPDLCQLGNTWVPEFHALGALEDLSSRVRESDAVDRDDYFAGIWDTNVIAGQTFGLPWYVDTRCVFYRADILAAAGVETFPANWDDWRHAMRRVKRHVGEKNFAILLPTNEWASPVILGLQTGAALLRDEGRYGNFRSARFRRAFDFYVGLFEERLAPSVSNTEISNIYQEFARGYFAMYITGPWNIGEFKRRLDGEMARQWATAPIPGPDGPETGVSLAGGSSLALFRTSQHKAEAWRLVEFLSQPKQQARFYRLAGALPPRKSVWQTAGLADDEYARAFYVQLGRVRPTPKVPEWERIATEVFHRAESIVQGDESTDAGLEKLDADVDRILEKRRWMLDQKR
jgi:multiple sugar transport system substrate-binding protein